MEIVYWILGRSSPSSRRCASPNMVTVLLVPAAGAGWRSLGWFGLASVLATLATFCDIVDGLLARKTACRRRRAG